MALVVYESEAHDFPRKLAEGGPLTCVLALLPRISDAALTQLKTTVIGNVQRERLRNGVVAPPEAADVLADAPAIAWTPALEAEARLQGMTAPHVVGGGKLVPDEDDDEIDEPTVTEDVVPITRE